MDSRMIQAFAGYFLNLNLTCDDAQSLVELLAAQKRAIDVIEKVGLASAGDGFATPRASDGWLERWPE